MHKRQGATQLVGTIKSMEVIHKVPLPLKRVKNKKKERKKKNPGKTGG